MENFNNSKKSDNTYHGLEGQYIENKELQITKNLENAIINAEPSTLEKCWGVMQSSATWTGIMALVMGGYMENELWHNNQQIQQNIVDTMGHAPSPEEMRKILMALTTFATSVVATGIALTITGVIHGNDIAKKDKNKNAL